MLLKTVDGAFHVTFRYEDNVYKNKIEKLLGKKMNHLPLRKTVCEFSPSPDHRYVGATTCRPPDQFKKSTGRKIAMFNALKMCYPGKGATEDKEIRARIWKAYFEKIRDLKASRRCSDQS